MFGSIGETANDLYDKAKDSAIVEEAEGMYGKAKKYANKMGKAALKMTTKIDIKDKISDAKDKAKDMYSGFKQKAINEMPTLISKLGDNITSSFMKFGNFLSDSIGDPKEHLKNMKEKVFKGISIARDSLGSIYTKLHDLFLLTKMRVEMEIKKLKDIKDRAKEKKKKGLFSWFGKAATKEFVFPNFLSPSAKISAGAGIGFEMGGSKNTTTDVLLRGHGGETGIIGASGNMSFVSPDKVRENLFGGLGINSKKVASMSAGKDILKMKQDGILQDSINGMKDTMKQTSQNSANIMSATIDKSIKIMNSNSNVSGGGSSNSQPSRSRDRFINLILSGNIT